MEPLSSEVPKPALDILGQPLLASSLRMLRRAGCDPLVVNVHRHPGAILRALRALDGQGTWSRLSWEPELLGSAGGIAAARRLFRPGPTLVANADIWADLDLAPLLAAHDPATAILALITNPDPGRWSVVECSADGRVTAIHPPGTSRQGYLFAGLQLLGEQVVAALPQRPSEIAPVWRALMAAGRLRGAIVTGSWREAGSPAAFHALLLELLGDRSWIAPGAEVAGDARLTASAVSSGCSVERGCQLRSTVVAHGAQVGIGSRLDHCLVVGPTAVAAGTRAEGTLFVRAGSIPL